MRAVPALAGLSALAALAVLAATPAPAANQQQDRMVACNAQAKTKALAGDPRKAFMASCLKGDTAAVSPQQRMKDCNVAAAGKTGGARKTFMSACLKG